jgi:hypothetical protein
MAKRFTDTEKWKDDWYISLSNDNKIVWQWLLDNCTIAGVCKPSIGLLNLMCRVTYTEEDLIREMDGRVIICNRVWFIPKFIKFQYSTLLSAKPAIVAVVRELFSYNLIKLIPESYGNDYLIVSESYNNHSEMIKDKDKDKVKDKVKVKELIPVNPEIEKNKINISFDSFWDLYDKKVGDKEKLKLKWEKLTDDERLKAMEHIPKYKNSQPDKKFRKDPQTYLNNKSFNDEIIGANMPTVTPQAPVQETEWWRRMYGHLYKTYEEFDEAYKKGEIDPFND